MSPSHIKRAFYVLHALQDNKSGRFDKTQHSEDFPDSMTHAEIKAELEDRLGRHYDGSWHEKKGFVDGISTQRILLEKSRESMAQEGRPDIQMDLLSGIDLKNALSTKPKSR